MPVTPSVDSSSSSHRADAGATRPAGAWGALADRILAGGEINHAEAIAVLEHSTAPLEGVRRESTRLREIAHFIVDRRS